LSCYYPPALGKWRVLESNQLTRVSRRAMP
jgi:hypothetical protein